MFIKIERGSTKFCLDFQALKLTCTGHTPTEQPFDNNFATTIKNLDNITKMTKHFAQKKGLILDNNHKIKFWHIRSKYIKSSIHSKWLTPFTITQKTSNTDNSSPTPETDLDNKG